MSRAGLSVPKFFRGHSPYCAPRVELPDSRAKPVTSDSRVEASATSIKSFAVTRVVTGGSGR